MTAPSGTVDLFAHNFNLGAIDFFAHLKRPPLQSLIGHSLLHDLARENDVLSAESLIDQGVDPDFADDQGRTPLHEAAFFGSTEMVSYLLDAGADINAALTPFGHTPLYLAVERGHLAATQLLVSAGAWSGVTNSLSGQSLLHMAAAKGDMRCTGILIRAGADVFAEDLKGLTPRDYAARYNHVEVERALLKVMEHRAVG